MIISHKKLSGKGDDAYLRTILWKSKSLSKDAIIPEIWLRKNIKITKRNHKENRIYHYKFL